MQTGEGDSPERAARIRRRDRHGRGLRGVLAPPGVPLYRTRTERFDDLVLQAAPVPIPPPDPGGALWAVPLAGLHGFEGIRRAAARRYACGK